MINNYKLNLPANVRINYKAISFLHEIDMEEGINEKVFTDTMIMLAFFENNIVRFKEYKNIKINNFLDNLNKVIGNDYLFKLSASGRISNIENRKEILNNLEKEKIALLTYDPVNSSDNLSTIMSYEELLKMEKMHLLFEFNGITNSMFVPVYNKHLNNNNIKITIGDLIPMQFIPMVLNTEIVNLPNNGFLLKFVGELDEEIISKNKFYAHLRDIYRIPMYESLNLTLGIKGYYVFKENNQYYESFLVKKTMRENYNLKEYIDYGYKI